MKSGTRNLLAIVIAFLAGVFVDSWLRVYGPPQPAEPGVQALDPQAPRDAPHDREADAAALPDARKPREPTGTSVRTRLRVPIDGVDVESMKGGFTEPRAGHAHEAVDILAPRNTPVHAVESGTVAKLFVSKAGGNTIYQFDPSGQLCYYYAHLERYAAGLHEGDLVKQGQVIGFVGTSGNAPPGTPHLHFAVFALDAEKKWWQGKAIDPYLVFRETS